MGFLDWFRGTPQWASFLPPSTRLTPDQLRRLDRIRREVQAPDEQFLPFVMGLPAMTSRLFRVDYQELKRFDSSLSEEDILLLLVSQRVEVAQAIGEDFMELLKGPESKLNDRIVALVRRFPTLQALLDAIEVQEFATFWLTPPSATSRALADRACAILREA